ncbi:hypothetical protein NH340_JMT08655 [Sarcoptes scabiei]|nr:hypothetical protein NH340_JMT08655 [Sarcoptes scabiei]
MIQSSKRTIAKTNDCSSLSKQSLINKGYYQDEYLQYFVASSKNVKRSPIINRGYYIRSKAIDFGWCKTIQSDHHNVVLSLGSGYDTSSFHHLDCFFIEFDYADVCRRKSEIIRQQNLYEEIDSKQQAQIEEIYFKSSRYLLIGIDLRETQRIEEILQSSSIKELLEAFLVRASTKTSINFILFNECSLCYLKQIDSDRLLSKLIEILPRLFEDRYLISIHYLGYEMYRSLRCRNDFDRFMLKHFSSIGAPIETFQLQNHSFSSIELSNYRHICSLINDRKIIQFGGAIPSQQSIRLYDIESDRMVRIESPPHLNLDRHSSAFTTHSSHSLLLNGGLDSSGHFLESSSLELLDFRDSMTLKCFRIENFDHRLYSHRMRMINENEVLIVGGINSRITSNTIYRIDLRQMKLLDQFQLALSGLNCRDKLLMFHNFALETNGASKFCTIGGGGNCFSFGTHFNPIVFFQI